MEVNEVSEKVSGGVKTGRAEETGSHISEEPMEIERDSGVDELSSVSES